MINLSERAKKLKPSATLGMAAQAIKMREEGIDVISFSTGEPDFDTPEHIKAAAKASLDKGFTKYTPPAGIAPLRKAISDKFKRDNGLDYSPEEITVTCGAKQAIANALLAIVDPGDEVIVPAPYWVSYPPQVKLAGGNPVIVDTTETGMKLDPDVLRKTITEKTRAIILNSPSNPTGIVYSESELKAVADICVEKSITVISDEIYEYLIFDGQRHVSIANLNEKMQHLTIVINGVSKGFSMTGWRLGWAAGPEEIIDKMSQMAGQQTTSPTSFVQEATVSALNGPMDEVHKMVKSFKERRDRMHSQLNSIPGINCDKPEGTFYLFPNMQSFIERKYNDRTIESDLALAELLLTEGHVAIVAGTPFGAPGFIRLSFATSMDKIDEGMKRLKKVLMEIE